MDGEPVRHVAGWTEPPWREPRVSRGVAWLRFEASCRHRLALPGSLGVDHAHVDQAPATIVDEPLQHCAKHVEIHLVVPIDRSEEHTSELQSLMRISYAVFCLKKKKKK